EGEARTGPRRPRTWSAIDPPRSDRHDSALDGIRLDAQLPQLRGKAGFAPHGLVALAREFVALVGGLVALARQLVALAGGLVALAGGLVALRIHLLEGLEPLAIGPDDPQVVRPLPRLEPDPEPGADEPRHPPDLLEPPFAPAPAFQGPGIGVVDVILLDPESIIELELAVHLGASVAR